MWRERFHRLRGWRTTAVCGLFGFVGLLNTLGAVDFQPLVSFFVSDDKQVGAIMVVLSTVFAVCRWATTTAIFMRETEDNE